MDGSIFTTELLCTTMYGLKVPSSVIGKTGSPVGGVDAVGAVGDRGAREQQGAQIAQVTHAGLTRRAFTAGRDERQHHVVAGLDVPSTPGPTSVTMPAPSWPPSTGKPAIGMSPVTRWWSEWHMPEASIWILTSSLTGSPISISSIDHGWLNSQMRAPFVFIRMCLPLELR